MQEQTGLTPLPKEEISREKEASADQIIDFYRKIFEKLEISFGQGAEKATNLVEAGYLLREEIDKITEDVKGNNDLSYTANAADITPKGKKSNFLHVCCFNLRAAFFIVYNSEKNKYAGDIDFRLLTFDEIEETREEYKIAINDEDYLRQLKLRYLILGNLYNKATDKTQKDNILNIMAGYPFHKPRQQQLLILIDEMKKYKELVSKELEQDKKNYGVFSRLYCFFTPHAYTKKGKLDAVAALIQTTQKAYNTSLENPIAPIAQENLVPHFQALNDGRLGNIYRKLMAFNAGITAARVSDETQEQKSVSTAPHM
jgi:hypothetical protein